jgi:hypothetical protein
MIVTTEACAACGHHVSWHGRRGYGACRHGRQTSGLAGAVDAVRAAVAAGLSKEEREKRVDEAFTRAACNCRRFRKTVVRVREVGRG